MKSIKFISVMMLLGCVAQSFGMNEDAQRGFAARFAATISCSKDVEFGQCQTLLADFQQKFPSMAGRFIHRTYFTPHSGIVGTSDITAKHDNQVRQAGYYGSLKHFLQPVVRLEGTIEARVNGDTSNNIFHRYGSMFVKDMSNAVTAAAFSKCVRAEFGQTKQAQASADLLKFKSSYFEFVPRTPESTDFIRRYALAPFLVNRTERLEDTLRKQGLEIELTKFEITPRISTSRFSHIFAICRDLTGSDA